MKLCKLCFFTCIAESVNQKYTEHDWMKSEVIDRSLFVNSDANLDLYISPPQAPLTHNGPLIILNEAPSREEL